MTIEERINEVVEARAKAKELKRQRDVLLEGWNMANQVLFDTLTQAGAEVAVAEDALREMAISTYSETGNKAVALGVGIRETKVYTYDSKEALRWAIEHKLALSLDKKAFEGYAKQEDFDFVTLTKEPTATIATELERVE